MRDRALPVALRIVLYYVLAASLWVLVSNRLIAFLMPLGDTGTMLVVLQDGAFVAVTALILFIILRHELHRRLTSERLAERYQLLADHARDIILFVDPSGGRILDANQAAEHAYGYTRAELQNMRVHDLRSGAEQALVSDQLRQAEAGGLLFEAWHRRIDGSLFPVEVSARGASIGGERILLSIVRDITERKRAAATLEASHKQVEDVLEFLPDATFVIDRSGVVVAWNQAMEALTGMPKKDVLGQSDFAHAVPLWGFRRPCLADLAMETGDESDKWYDKVERAGSVLRAEAIVPAVYQGRGAPLWFTAAPLCDEGGQKIGAIECIRDVTAHHETERRLRKSVRALEVLSEANQALVRAAGETQLLDDVCRILVKESGYRAAWVGLTDGTGPEAKVRIAAHSGDETRLLKLDAFTAAEALNGTCSMRRAIGSGKPCVVRDPCVDPLCAPWREAATARDCAASAALPLAREGVVFGALCLEADSQDAFDEDELALLGELADDLAYGITALRTRVERERAEAALRASEAHYRLLFRDSPTALWEEDFSDIKAYIDDLKAAGVTDFMAFLTAHPEAVRECIARIRVLDVNNAVVDLYQAHTREHLLAGVDVILDDSSLPAFRDELVNIAAGRTPFEHEMPLHTLEHEPRQVIVSWAAATGHETTLDRVYVAITDVTARRRAEKALQESEAKYRNLVETAHDLIWSIDAQGIITFVNGAALDVYGFPPEEIVGRDIGEFGVPEERESNRDMLARALGSGGEYSSRVLNRNGEEVQLLTNAVVLRDEQGRMVGMSGTSKNMTAYVKVVEALRESEQRARRQLDEINQVYRYAPVGLFALDRDYRVVRINERMANIIGLPPDGQIGKGLEETVPDLAASLREVLDPVYARGEPVLGVEYQGTSQEAPGVVHCWLGNYFPLLGDDGAVIGMSGALQEITDHKRSEAALAEERNLLRTLIDNIPDYIYVKDKESRFLLANVATALSFGRKTPEEIYGKTDLDFHVGSLAQRFRAEEQELLRFGRSLSNHEEYMVLPSGETQWLNTTKVPLRDRQGNITGLVGIGRDTTEHKAVEQSLWLYAERLALLHEIDQGILGLRSPQDIASATLHSLAELVPYWGAIVAVFEPATGEARLLATELAGSALGTPGTLIPAGAFDPSLRELSESRVTPDVRDLPLKYAAFEALVAAGVRAVAIIPLVMQGRVIGLLSVCSDRTGAFTDEQIVIAREVADELAIAVQQASLQAEVERHTAELEGRVVARTAELSETAAMLQVANDQLVELDRLKTRFVSNVSHEFRTPLNNIKLYLELLRMGRPEKREQYLATLCREADLLQNLIDDLLQLSRLDLGTAQLDFCATDLNDLLVSLVADRGLLVSQKGLSLETSIETALPYVPADPRMINQVLSNLLTNAMNYTPPGGRIVAGTAQAQVEGQPGATIFVSDSGPGIKPEDMPHLFERFYRGAAARESRAPGTGLGLAICDEIIKRHQGRIWVESRPGHGATFTVWLPAPLGDSQRILLEER